jgi:putative sterol carrier protein
MKMSMFAPLEDMVNKFNHKTAKDEKLKENLQGIEKRINLDLGDEHFCFILDNGEAHSLQKGMFNEPDVTITSDPATLTGLMEKTIRPMRAYAQKKFQVKGKLEDLLHLRKLF